MNFFKIFAISILTALVLTALWEYLMTIFPNNKVTGIIIVGAIIWAVTYVAAWVVEPKRNKVRKLRW